MCVCCSWIVATTKKKSHLYLCIYPKRYPTFSYLFKFAFRSKHWLRVLFHSRVDCGIDRSTIYDRQSFFFCFKFYISLLMLFLFSWRAPHHDCVSFFFRFLNLVVCVCVCVRVLNIHFHSFARSHKSA